MCIKNSEGFGLQWHPRGHRGGLWQDKQGHADLQSLGLPDYWGILPLIGIVSLFYPQVWWLFALKRTVCRDASSQSVLYSLLTADAIMPLICFCNLCARNYEPWAPDLGREAPSPRRSSVKSTAIHLAYSLLCLCIRRKASQSREMCNLVLFLV